MEQVVQALARQQCRLGVEVEVLTSDQGARDVATQAETFRVTRLRSAEIAHTTITPTLLPRLFRLDRAALIHLHISTAYTPEMVWLQARLRGGSYVAHLHLDVLPSGPAGVLLERYKRVGLRRVLRDAAAVLVPTGDYRDLVVAKYQIPSAKVIVIRNGTDHQIATWPRSHQGGGVKRLLFVGRLSVQKNIPLMLEAIAEYRRGGGPPVSLTIVGDGEIAPAVAADIRRLGLQQIVAMRGSLHGDELQAAYEEADLLVLTSVNESFGLVLIEAMTKALPIVTVDIPAVRNVVRNGINGLLAEPTPDGVASAILRLLTDNDLYAEISRNNLAESAGYAWPAIAREMINLYASL